MRFLATVVTVLAMSVSAASADAPEQALFALFKDVCLTPAEPEGIMAAAEKAAAAGEWRLIKSGRGRLPMLHDMGPEGSRESFWEFNLPQVADVKLSVSIGAEFPEIRHTICMFIVPDQNFSSEKTAFEIAKHYGRKLALVWQPKAHWEYQWYFSQLMAAGDCGKSIVLTHDNVSKPSYSLGFMEMRYPKDGKWDGLAAATRCRFPPSK
jgi:hypothetical protein